MAVDFFGQPIRAVLLDLDGTLYRQRPLRLRMAAELLWLPLRSLSLGRAREVWRSIGCFRKVREELRALGQPDDSLDELQYSAPAERIGGEAAAVRAIIEEWMYRRPLRHLRPYRREGVLELFEFLRARDVEIGVFSDYPVADKLQALDLAGHASLALCATDPEINAFKPHPAGFIRACRMWGLEPADVLYVGDRADVDAAGAQAAGMACALITSEQGHGEARTFTGFERLKHAFDDHR